MVLDSGWTSLLCCHPQHDRILAQSHFQEDKGRGMRLIVSFPPSSNSFATFLSVSLSERVFPPPTLLFCCLSFRAVTCRLFQLLSYTATLALNFCPLLNFISMIRQFYNLIDCLPSKHINTVILQAITVSHQGERKSDRRRVLHV